MKYEWRKQDKEIYLPKRVSITEIDSFKHIMIEGKGNPNSTDFKECVEALYALSYGIKMAPKKNIKIDGYFEYTVFPLEGIWDLTGKGKELYSKDSSVIDIKDELVYQIMIRQPDFVTDELFDMIKESAYLKKNNKIILDSKLIKSKESTVCQTIHLGSYDNEPETFSKMEEYCQENGYDRLSKVHTEIYISDPRKVSPEKLKTTLRFEVKKK
ncbi:hypothetical protein KQ51_00151 [Candidatus Izimaplasma bacterium HR1]|jgi:hypothetical protein|uniref:GyrI-like domain-containing protein n=1 Tax=Candidatus Izimoplasma sp. HR1 TaxID=1541959 RepID=UPI0004F8E050|nr:hypothetical protein KQ51_00151 [Candidatus Izimaplasma bacterium HR1]